MRQDLLQTFLLESSVVSALDERGFRKSGSTWNATAGGVARVVDFQVGRQSDPGSLRFTMNLGVALEEVWRVYYGRPLDFTVDEADCFPRFRIGDVIAGFSAQAKDLWWNVTRSERPDHVATEVKSLLLDRCLPLLDRLDSLDSVFSFVEKEAPLRSRHAYSQIMWAIVRYLHGEPRTAEALLLDLEANPRLGDEWRRRIAEVVGRLRGLRVSRD